MLKNYLKIALRSLWKNKGFSAINIFGLAIGLATCLIIVLYVVDELSYDKFYENADRIYRINSDISFGGSKLHFTQTSDMMGALLKKDYPQVEKYTRIYTSDGEKLIKKNNEFIRENKAANVDSTFFSIFHLPVIDGDTKTALDEPNTVVITAAAAKKYFDDTHVVGRILEVKNDSNTTPYKITAVVEDIPHNSHLDLQFMFSMKNVDYNWGQLTSHNFHTYLLLKKGTDPKAFQKNFTAYIDKYVLPEVKSFIDIKSMADFEKTGNYLFYTLLPLTKIHLYSDYNFEITPPGNIQYVYIFGAVALFILVIACINFINLSTARSVKRAKEVGIRKTLGTERRTLLAQFLVESTITVCIALALAVAAAWFALPLFNTIAGKSIAITELFSGKLLILLILMPFVVGILAGLYPAVFLSRFNPIVVLKSSTAGAGFKKSTLRSTLVVFQFLASIVLITGTIIVYSQLRFIQTTQLGFNKDQVLVIDGAYVLGDKAKAFKEDILGMTGVMSGTLSSYLPVTSSSRSDNTYSKDAVMDSKNGIDMQTWRVDYDYVKTMGMEIVKGRNFSKEYADSNAVIINETTAKFLDYDNPVGHKIFTLAGNTPKGLDIIGVVKDFHFESLHQSVGPLCMVLGKNAGLASFKINPGSAAALIPKIEARWKAFVPSMPFSYRFMDDSFNEMYKDEQRVGRLAVSFAVLAILIACLGLFGLATYMAEQRTKEIGVRKVLGSSVSGIIQLLSKDFIRLVSIAFVIAVPLAWYIMNKWLQDFAYRIHIQWWVFAAAGLLALVIALLTVSTQAIKAALANPVKSLRTE